ncbi:hypothetical protein PG990_008255 [Apiospora arundinis]|uniref:Uncharacterized protein n=1 Tax=Apiospora arundinis TaxID=335852 RepID=A0ABR2JLV2_9PEZI
MQHERVDNHQRAKSKEDRKRRLRVPYLKLTPGMSWVPANSYTFPNSTAMTGRDDKSATYHRSQHVSYSLPDFPSITHHHSAKHTMICSPGELYPQQKLQNLYELRRCTTDQPPEPQYPQFSKTKCSDTAIYSIDTRATLPYFLATTRGIDHLV